MKEFLQTVKAYSERSGTENCCALLDAFIKSGEFCNRAVDLLAQPKMLEEIATQSNLHTNHFAKIVLAKYAGWNLRMHVWPTTPTEQIHEPHDHRWNFSSYVLSGVVVNQIIKEQSDGEIHDKYIAHPTELNQRRPYDFANTVGIHTVAQETHAAGHSYFHPTKVIHIARIPPNTATATLFLTAPACRENSFIYMPNHQPPPSQIVLDQMTPEDVITRLTTVVRFLKGDLSCL